MGGLIAMRCDSLTTLNISGLSVGTLNITGSPQISTLRDFNYIGSLNASGCTALRSIVSPSLLGVDNLGIGGTMNVTGCTRLVSIDFSECGLTSLDLSSCISLSSFAIHAPGSGLRYLNIKNGRQTNIYFTGFSSSQDVLNICADDFEITSVRATLNNVYGAPYNISQYCSFVPGGNYNTIQGKVRIDDNNNGCDNNDRGLPQVPIRMRDTSGNTLISYTDSFGAYVYHPYRGLFTLTPYFPYPFFTINPSNTTVGFDTANSLLNTSNFCVSGVGIHNDLEIILLPTFPVAKPGFNAGYELIYKNRGTTALSGNVLLTFNSAKMNFVSAGTAVTLQSAGQLSWNYNNLLPFESRKINLVFNLLAPPVNNAGDTLTYLASITPSSNDETPYDNSFILPQRVRAANDPNEKECLEGSKIDISKIGDFLHYVIHFQNIGTDTAINVVVVDTLSNKLDWSSFEFTGSSHFTDIKLSNNKAEFIFENIKLPYKAINEPASNGYVAFKIKPTNTDVVGDSLNNKAAIYFDFNLPVATNTATTIITSLSPVPVKLEYFSITHKTSSNELNWKATCTFGNATFEIERSDDGIHFTNIGNITASTIRCQLPLSFTDNHPTAGKNYYRLKITDADGISFYSKTLVIGNNKAGFEITTISNSNIYFNSSKQQGIQLKLLAADGKLIYATSKTITSGSNQINLPIKNAATGIYTLVVYTNDGEVVTKKFIR